METTFLDKLERFGNRVDSLVGYITVPLYLFLIGIVFMQVVGRYLSIPIPAANELALFSFVWIVYLTAALATRNQSHFKIEMVDEIMKKRPTYRYYKALINFAMILVALVMIVYGWRASILAMDRMAPGSEIPLVYTFISVPLCGFLMILFLVTDTLRLFGKQQSADK